MEARGSLGFRVQDLGYEFRVKAEVKGVLDFGVQGWRYRGLALLKGLGLRVQVLGLYAPPRGCVAVGFSVGRRCQSDEVGNP